MEEDEEACKQQKRKEYLPENRLVSFLLNLQILEVYFFTIFLFEIFCGRLFPILDPDLTDE